MADLARLVLRLAAGLGLAAAAGMAAADTLRVVIPNPPIGRGNPYQASGPANAYVAPAIFDALTVIDRDGEVQPGLALSWQSDASGRTWTFWLRPGVTFSNGAPFDADSVVAALNYMTGKPQPADLVLLEFSDVAGFRALDPLTVEVVGRGPIPLLPRAASVLFVVEPETWRRLGPQEFAAAPVGTGPFKVDRWGAAGIALSAASQSWRRPNVDGLEFLFQLEATARLQSLLAGRSDIVFGVGVEDRAALDSVGATLVFASIPQVTTLMLLAAKPGSPFADVRVRQAVNYAVDKTRLVDAFFGGQLPTAGQPAARTAIGYNPELAPYPYDPARAKALLREAGRENGFTFAIDAAVGSSGPDGAIYQQIAQDLAAVGITMDIRAMPGIRFGQVFRAGSWEGDAFAFHYTAVPTFDALRSLKYYQCASEPAVYCDPGSTPLLDQAEQAPTLSARADIARRVMARYHEQAAALFLFETPGFHAVGQRVRGFRMDNMRIAFEEIELAR